MRKYLSLIVYLPSGAFDLAQSAIFRLSPVVWLPIDVIFYSIFYHNLGTVEKTVLELSKKVRSTNLQESDKISLEGTWISEKYVEPYFSCNNEVSKLGSDVA